MCLTRRMLDWIVAQGIDLEVVVFTFLELEVGLGGGWCLGFGLSYG